MHTNLFSSMVPMSLRLLTRLDCTESSAETGNTATLTKAVITTPKITERVL